MLKTDRCLFIYSQGFFKNHAFNRDTIPFTVDQIARFREDGDLIWDSQ